MHTIRGNSGANVRVTPAFTVKYAPLTATPDVRERIVMQGLKMRDNSNPAYPLVHLVFEHGYVMETLNPIKYATRQIHEVSSLIDVLVETVLPWIWGNRFDAEGTCLGALHEHYVFDRAARYAPHVLDRMRRALERVRNSTLTHCSATHGDPTLDNTMCRATGQYVITDPLPSSLAVPRLWAVDLAKLMQSAFGYEGVIGHPGFPNLSPGDLTPRFMENISEADNYATWYFLGVHILRLMPYQFEAQRKTFAQWFDAIPL